MLNYTNELLMADKLKQKDGKKPPIIYMYKDLISKFVDPKK
jgi:hypothetical protein